MSWKAKDWNLKTLKKTITWPSWTFTANLLPENQRLWLSHIQVQAGSSSDMLHPRSSQRWACQLRCIVWVVDTWPAEAGTSCPVSAVASCCLHKAKRPNKRNAAMLCQNVKPGRQEGVENQIFLGLVANEIEPAPRSKGQWWSMLRSVTLPPDSSHVENGALHWCHHFYGRKGKPVNPSANQSLAHMYFNPPIVEVKTWRQCCDSLPVTRGSSNFKTTGLCSIRPCQR